MAHFTRTNLPAIGALPTGVGKTGTIAVLPFLMPARRALVVVPTRLLREQLFDELANMKLLKRLGVLPATIPNPSVGMIDHEVNSEAQWESLTKHDAVIATPYCISPAMSGVVGPPAGLFDLLIFDEAHHTAAPTWSSLLDCLRDSRCMMVTATPYRRDHSPLPGILVYDYSMKRALQEEYISPLSREIVSFNDVGDPDVALVRKVAELTRNNETYRGVPFLVRTATVAHARELTKLYREAGLNVDILLGEHSLKHANRVVRTFREGQVQGLVIVGVLGEGFDFPDIKLGAYHRRHKSLAPTLQFLGRLARKSASDVPALVLVPAHAVHDETAGLYAENAEWSELIPDLADKAVELEIDEAATRAAFGNLADELIAPETLMPQRVVSIFAVSSQDTINLTRAALPDEVRKIAFQWFEPKNSSEGFIAWLTAELQPPRWARRTKLNERILSFNAAVYVSSAQMLVIAGEKGAEARSIAEAFGISQPRPIDPEQVQGYLKELGVQSYYNVGMRSVEPPSDLRPTYKQSTGPSIDSNAILPAERDAYAFGHGTARMLGEHGPESLGVAVRSGRFWSPQNASSLSAFVQWCRELAIGLHGALRQRGAPSLDLRTQTKLVRFPRNPIFAELEPQLLSRNLYILFGGQAHSLESLDLIIGDSSSTGTELRFLFEGTVLATVSFDLSGAATFASDHILRAPDQLEPIDGSQLFTDHPGIVYYGDGSSVHGAILVPPSDRLIELPPDLIDALDWTNVDVRREKQGRNGLKSIHDFIIDYLRLRYPGSLIINDDGAGEIADVIVVQRSETNAKVRLYHCKGATGAGANLQDLYEVLGQAQRSARWASDPRAFWREASARIRTRFRLKSGKLDEVIAYLDANSKSAPHTAFMIYIVQPGIDATRLVPGDNINVVLSMTNNVIRAHNATFSVFGSDRNVQSP